MDNAIVASPNILVLCPIYLALNQKDFLTALCLMFLGITSFVSRLIECHKNGMPGIGYSQYTSYIWNRLAILGYLIIGSRLLYLFLKRNRSNIIDTLCENIDIFAQLGCSFILTSISKYDEYNAALKNRYIIAHCLWYINSFLFIGLIYQRLYINYHRRV